MQADAEQDLEQLRYPVGRFQPERGLTAEQIAAMVDEIAALPARLRAAVQGLSDRQLDTPYRPGGWTVRQVVHHVPDSHMNAYVRFKLALTEDQPTIRPYAEAAWAELADAKGPDIEGSLLLLEALHRRWTTMLRSLEPADYQRRFVHPDIGVLKLETNLQIYAWHCRHHLAHITGLCDRMGWRA